MYTCPICHNNQRNYFGLKNGEIYCRKCISFIGEKIINQEEVINNPFLNINYQLSEEQKKISSKVVDLINNKKNVLINAVCGAGKTELVYEVILNCLKKGYQIGFAIPRKDVVIDLYPRIKEAFSNQQVVAVYGGHHSNLKGNIIILTTHQLYRYENYFDLLILDEIDAFPFQNNDTLNCFFKKSLKGNYIMMSATARDKIINEVKKDNGEVLFLDKRYHNHPLPVPKMKSIIIGKIFYLWYLLYYFKKKKLPVLVFVPTIDECEELYNKCKFIKNGYFVHSKKEDREQIIMDFKNNKYDYLITTSVLERGVTIKNLQVIVFNAEHELYDEKSLIQISGRVGRKIDAYEGEVIFIASYITEEMQKCCKEIIRANES